MAFAFDPPDGYENTTEFPTKPLNEAAFRASMQTLLNQIRDYLNGSGDIAIKSADNNFLVSQTINGSVTSNGTGTADLVLTLVGLLRGAIHYDGSVGELTIRNYNVLGDLSAEIKTTNSGDMLFNDNEVWDTGNSSLSPSANGYQRMVTGTILQWGATGSVSSGGAILFPASFVGATRAVIPVVDNTTPCKISIGSFTNDGFTVYHDAGGPVTIRWIAVGI